MVFYSFFCICNCGSSNAVNLTDGLDGLATVPVILLLALFCIYKLCDWKYCFSEYLQIPYIEGTGEVSIFCGAIIGSCLVFYGLMLHQQKFLWETQVL